MFDFAWTEIALIGVVALIAIGPKDMPKAIKGIADFIKKARRMAGEFQSHVDEMVKDTELADVRNQISQLRSFDFKGEVEKAIDTDGTLRSTLRDDPFRQGIGQAAGKPVIDPAPAAAAPAAVAPVVTEQGSVSIEPIESPVAASAIPAFIPPAAAAAMPPPPLPPAAQAAAPSFVPPSFSSAEHPPAGSGPA